MLDFSKKVTVIFLNTKKRILVSLSKDDTIIKMWSEMMRTQGHNQSRSIGLLLYHFIKTNEIISLGKVPKNMLFPQKRSIELYDIHPEVEEWLEMRTINAFTNRSELIKTILHQSLEYCDDLSGAWCPSLQEIRKKTICHSLLIQSPAISQKSIEDTGKHRFDGSNVVDDLSAKNTSRAVVPTHTDDFHTDIKLNTKELKITKTTLSDKERYEMNTTGHHQVANLLKMANASSARKGVPKDIFADIQF